MAIIQDYVTKSNRTRIFLLHCLTFVCVWFLDITNIQPVFGTSVVLETKKLARVFTTVASQQQLKIMYYAFDVVANINIPIYEILPPFLAFAVLLIIWRLSSVVVPPFHQGMIWSACISSIGSSSPVIGHTPFCLS